MKKRNSRTFLPIRPGKNKDKSAAAEHSGSDETSSSFCDARYCPETGIAVRRCPARGRSHKARARQRSNSRLCEEASAEAGPLSMNGQSRMFTKKRAAEATRFERMRKILRNRPVLGTEDRCPTGHSLKPALDVPVEGAGTLHAGGLVHLAEGVEQGVEL